MVSYGVLAVLGHRASVEGDLMAGVEALE
jgi:hypothetical protein